MQNVNNQPTPSTAHGPDVCSLEAEKSVLGSMLVEPSLCIDRALEQLDGKDFYHVAHQVMFEALSRMHREQLVIDLVTVIQYLSDRNQLQIVGGPGEIANLANTHAYPHNIGSYIGTIRDKSAIRQLQQEAFRLLGNIQESPTNSEAHLAGAESALLRIADTHLVQKTQSVRDVMEHALQKVKLYRDRKQPLTGIPTGFHKLNEMTCGWQPGDMIVLAARPGAGKTALAMSFARTAVTARYNSESDSWEKPGSPVGIFSLEMTNEQLMLRLTAMTSGENFTNIRSGKLPDFEMNRIEQNMGEIATWPLYLDDSGDLTVHQLRSKARMMKTRFGIELLIIDYLQLLHGDSKQARDNRQNEVAECSRAIKALAKELAIPVIVLAQLNRKADEKNAEPGLHNLRESGAIEQDADLVMLLHRISDEGEGDSPASPIARCKLKIAKHRNGPTDDLLLNFNAPCVRFEDPARFETRLRGTS